MLGRFVADNLGIIVTAGVVAALALVINLLYKFVDKEK